MKRTELQEVQNLMSPHGCQGSWGSMTLAEATMYQWYSDGWGSPTWKLQWFLKTQSAPTGSEGVNPLVLPTQLTALLAAHMGVKPWAINGEQVPVLIIKLNGKVGTNKRYGRELCYLSPKQSSIHYHYQCFILVTALILCLLSNLSVSNFGTSSLLDTLHMPSKACNNIFRAKNGQAHALQVRLGLEVISRQLKLTIIGPKLNNTFTLNQTDLRKNAQTTKAMSSTNPTQGDNITVKFGNKFHLKALGP